MPFQRIIACFALIVALGSNAMATVVAGRFSGVIDGNTYDSYGLFGPAGADLGGETLTATYRYDTAAAFSYTAQSTSDAYMGVDNLSLTVTIGNTTVTTGTVDGSEIIASRDGPATTVELANFAPTPLIDFSLFALGPWIAGVTIDAPFTLDPAGAGQTIYVSADGAHYDTLDFTAEAVPLPGPLGPLATGLAALGCVRWRRTAGKR